MLLSLLASYAVHKLFHKISICISASKNSSIVTFFQLCHKPPGFLARNKILALIGSLRSGTSLDPFCTLTCLLSYSHLQNILINKALLFIKNMLFEVV